MIKSNKYKKRLQVLSKNLKNNSFAIFFANKLKVRTNDTNYSFCQNKNFFYLSGLSNTDIKITLFKDNKGNLKITCFNKVNLKTEDIWQGKRETLTNIKEQKIFDEVLSLDKFANYYQKQINQAENLYIDFQDSNSKEFNFSHLKKNHLTLNILDLDPLLAKMRVIKDQDEIKKITTSCNISIKAHKKVIKKINNLDYEYNIEALFAFEFKNNNATFAYEPIIANSNNATFLHYNKNNQPLQKNKLVLLDVGAEYQGYAADITRTFPTSGKFTQEQKEIYNIVLNAQKEAISLIKPGVNFSSLQKVAQKIITLGLINIGLIKEDFKKAIIDKKYQDFYMHSIGHFLGLDTHDAGSFYNINKEKTILRENMVLTIEPGIYINENIYVSSKYKGIGVRIEDNILVTKTGCKNLTESLPREIKDIENIIS